MNKRCRDEDEKRAAVGELLAPFPHARGWSLAEAPLISQTTSSGAVSTIYGGSRMAWLTWVSTDEDGRRVITGVETMADFFEDRLYLRPGLGSSKRLVSPLITWWGVLLALSSLARYEPVAWRDGLDMDNSPIAWVLEKGLTVAQRRIPELVLDALVIPDLY